MVQLYTRLKIGQFILPYNPKSVSVKLAKKLVRISVPGRDGDIIQLLGMATKEITFSGEWVKDADLQNIKLLQEFVKREPLDLVFPLKINQLTNPTKIIVDSVSLNAGEGDFDFNTYSVSCLEWRPVEVKQNVVNLINLAPKQQMQEVIRQQGRG